MASRQTALPLLHQLNSFGQRNLKVVRRYPRDLKALASGSFPLFLNSSSKRWNAERANAVAVGLSLVILLPLLIAAPGLVISAMLAGFFVGSAASWSLMRSNTARLLQAPNLSRIADFDFDGSSLTFSMQRNVPLLLEGGMPGRMLSAAFGALASAIVLVGGLISRPVSSLSGSLFLSAAVWMTPIAVAAFLFKVRLLERSHIQRLKRQIETLVTAANSELQCVREVEPTFILTETLCGLLNISPPSDYRKAVARFIVGNSMNVVLDPGYGISFFRAIGELASEEAASLTDLLPIHERLQTAILLGTAAVEESGNPFLGLQVENLAAQSAGLRNLLSQRRWDDYRQSCLRSIEQLHAVKEQARREKEPSAVLPAGTDAYRILGIDRETACSDVRRLRTRLALIYHPDAAEGFANSSKMAEINAAFDAVMADRKQK